MRKFDEDYIRERSIRLFDELHVMFYDKIELLTEQAAQGDAIAQYKLGDIYYFGEESLFGYAKKDMKKANYWYSKAVESFTKLAKQGNTKAMYYLSQIFWSPRARAHTEVSIWKREDDILKGKNLLFMAAEQGNAGAQYALGRYQKYGELEKWPYQGAHRVGGNKKSAHAWFMAAAQQGHEGAQCELGLNYISGKGVAKNLEQGIYWLTKAAEQRNSGAQYSLGCNYVNEKEIRDLEKARYWFNKVEEGFYCFEEAQKALAQLDKGAKSIKNEYNKGNCYVATCVYGSYDCPEVWTLRRFRDNILSSSWFGRCFINIYYTIGPKVVNLFGNTKWFNGLWKPILDKFVRKLQNRGIDSSPYSDVSFQHDAEKNISPSSYRRKNYEQFG